MLQNLSDDPAAHLLSVYIIFTILLYACVIPRRIHLDRIKSSPDGLSLLAKSPVHKLCKSVDTVICLTNDHILGIDQFLIYLLSA